MLLVGGLELLHEPREELGPLGLAGGRVVIDEIAAGAAEDLADRRGGEVAGLGAFCVTATFTAIIVRVANLSFRLEPEDGKLGTRWVAVWVRTETESTPFRR